MRLDGHPGYRPRLLSPSGAECDIVFVFITISRVSDRVFAKTAPHAEKCIAADGMATVRSTLPLEGHMLKHLLSMELQVPAINIEECRESFQERAADAATSCEVAGTASVLEG